MPSFSFVLVLAAAGVGAGADRDVPKGYCHLCEVSCFEDCTAKYDREIITPDLTGKDRLSRKETRVEGAMKKKLYGVVLSQNGTASQKALVDTFSSCLKQDRCPCPLEEKGNAPSFLAAAGGKKKKKKCAVGERRCAVGCANKTVSAPTALLQAAAVPPGPSDPDDAAIPWSINIHPVKINTFATGRQNLDRCFKSCLAATCGCDDAPGMDAIDDLNSAIKANDEAKDPVEDSSPMWQYEHAPIDECAKGMVGKKVTSGLYADMAGGPDGWVEVCSDEFFNAMGTPADIGKKNCGNNKALLAGCIWDETKGECVYGLKKKVRCYHRYKDDNKL